MSVKSSESQEVKVISGQEHGSSVIQRSQKFYSKKHTSSEVESLLVRPLYQSLRTFNTQKPTRSGVKALQHVTNNSSVRKDNSFSKTRVFWNNSHDQIPKNRGQSQETQGKCLGVIEKNNENRVMNVANNEDTSKNAELCQEVADNNYGKHNRTQSVDADRGIMYLTVRLAVESYYLTSETRHMTNLLTP